MIPDVQLVEKRRVGGRDEIDDVVRDVHDVLVRADAVEVRHVVVGQLLRLNGEPESGMREAGDGALRFRPSEDGQVPGRPILDLARAGIVLVAQSQEDEMPAVARREAGDLQVVAEQRVLRRHLVVTGLEELPLVIVGRTPIEHATHA